MNLLQTKALSHLQQDLTDILDHCFTRDQIVIHFSQYLLGELTQANIDDYDFFPNVTMSGIDVTVHVFFPWDSTARHEFTVVKRDSPGAAYNRAMGIV